MGGIVQKLTTRDNAKYISSWIGGGVLSFSLSIATNYSLYRLGYSHGEIALYTALSKILGFYTGNIGCYYLLHLDKPLAERIADIKTLAHSNLKGALTSLVLRIIFHYLLLRVAVDPVLSYLICYPLASLAGTCVKFRHDTKRGLFLGDKQSAEESGS